MTSPVNYKWRIATVIFAFATIYLSYELLGIRSQLNSSVFHYDVEVLIVDRNTGSKINETTTLGPDQSGGRLLNKPITFSGNSVRGSAYYPLEFTFSADGYNQEKLMITKHTPKSVTIALEPLKKVASSHNETQ